MKTCLRDLHFDNIAAVIATSKKLEAAGHVAMVGSKPQAQPASVRAYLYVVVVGVPCLLMTIATFIKYRMPFVSQVQVDQIHRGVKQHVQGKPALDPITGEFFELVAFKQEDDQSLYLLNNWQDASFLDELCNVYDACLECAGDLSTLTLTDSAQTRLK